MQVIAHRGASFDAPENTMAAFELAAAQGADMIETDLHLLKDGEVLLWHDHSVNGDLVGSLTLAELRQLLPDVVTLDEALDAFGSRIPFNLELKSTAEVPYEGLERLVVERVRARGLLERSLFSCFHDATLQVLRTVAEDARIGLLVSGSRNWFPRLRAHCLRAESIHFHLGTVTERRVRGAHSRGFRVAVYTVDDPADWARLASWGVDAVFTNRPGEMRASLSD